MDGKNLRELTRWPTSLRVAMVAVILVTIGNLVFIFIVAGRPSDSNLRERCQSLLASQEFRGYEGGHGALELNVMRELDCGDVLSRSAFPE